MIIDRKDICKHLNLPASPEVQAAYDAMMDAREAEKAAGEAWVTALKSHQKSVPLLERMKFAAYARCDCGAGLAYDPAGASGEPFGGYWRCSLLLLEQGKDGQTHSPDYPFAFYSIKSEGQPSAEGATTRPVSP